MLEWDPPRHNPADLLACSGLRAQLRLEQRLLRSKDGNGLWCAQLSSGIIVVKTMGHAGSFHSNQHIVGRFDSRY